MKNRFLILVVVAATLFACSGDSMISDDFNETAEKKQKSFPLKVIKMAGTYEFGPGFETSIEDCAATTGLIAEGEGNIAHLGLTTVLEEWCWNAGFSGSGEIDLGKRYVTFTAANGDELWGEIESIDYPGFVFPTSFDFSVFIEEVTIIGGSGRFENACGNIIQTVVTTPDASTEPSLTEGFGTFTYSAEGTITYNCPEEE